MDDKKIIGIVIAVAVLVALIWFMHSKGILFATLPAGQYSAPSDCSFITNEDPYTAVATAYGNTGVWIAIDTNGDVIKEKFGEYAKGGPAGACQAGIGECTGFGTLAVKNYNTNGDDIYINGDIVYVATSSGYYTLFKKDSGAASNAIITCTTTPPTCTENWQCGTWSACASGQQTRTCTDANNCGTSTSKPALTQSCGSPSSLGDANGDGKVDRNELGIVINNWLLS